MADGSHIEWTEATWNPLVGCTKVSPGCDHCYAETLVNRFAGSSRAFPNRFDVVTIRDDDFLTKPLRWTKPRLIFVNSLSDLFHTDVPDEVIAQVFAVMAVASRHTFQLLTKRHARARALLSSPNFADLYDLALRDLMMSGRITEKACATAPPLPLPNLWLGVSVEDQHWANVRIPALLDTPAAVRWISAEPLLGELHLGSSLGPYGVPGVCFSIDGDWWHTPGESGGCCRRGLDWVVAGGESGPGARPIHPEWAGSIRDQCAAAEVPFLWKQWGSWAPAPVGGTLSADSWVNLDGSTVEVVIGTTANVHLGAVVMRHMNKKIAGRVLDGRTWDGYPAAHSSAAGANPIRSSDRASDSQGQERS